MEREDAPTGTLGSWAYGEVGDWCWVYCFEPGCDHYGPLDLVRLAERYGEDVPFRLVVERLTCPKCGVKGRAGTRSRSWSTRGRGFQDWPEAQFGPRTRDALKK